MSARRAFVRGLLPMGLLLAFGLGAVVSPRMSARGGTKPRGGPRVETPPRSAAPPRAEAKPDPKARLDAVRAEVRRLAGALLAQIDDLEELRGALDDQKFTSERARAEAIKARRVREDAEMAILEFEDRTFPDELKQAREEVAKIEANVGLLDPQHKWWKDMVRFGYRAPLQLKQFEENVLEPTRQALEESKKRLKGLESDGKALRLAELRREADDAATAERYWGWARDLEAKHEAKLRHQVEEKTLSPRQQQILALLDEAVALGGPGPVKLADSGGDPPVTVASADRAEAKLAEALRLAGEEEAERTARRDEEIRHRLRALAEESGRPHSTTPEHATQAGG